MPSGDARIDAGLSALAHYREGMVSAGETQVGWKIGFGSPSGLELLGLDGPIIGVLWASGAASATSPVAVMGWTAPVVECEVAAYLASDISPGTPASAIDARVGAWGPAFEFADIDEPPRDVALVLQGNIFQRGYLLGPAQQGMTSHAVMSLVADVTVDGAAQRVSQLTALTGHLAEVIARAADLAPDVGRPLRAGDLILTGSIVTPIAVKPGTEVVYALEGFPPLTAAIA